MSFCLVFLASCNNSGPKEDTTVRSRDSSAINIDTTRSTFSRDLEAYRLRISTRINELDDQITEWRRERKAERNEKKQRDYDERIAKRERLRNDFKERLEKLKTQTEDGWQKFKSDMDNFFSRNNSDTTLKSHY